MIALSLIKNKKLKIIEKNIPKILHPLKCRLQILYSAICASDIPRAFDNMAYAYPLVMGHEFVGRIIQVGKSVTKFNKNDTVSVYPLIPQCIHNNKKNKCENCNNKNYNLCNNYSYYGSRTDGSFCEILDVYAWNLYKMNKKINYNICSLIEPTAVVFNILDKFPNILSKKNRVLLIGSGFIGQILARILKKKNSKINLTTLDRNSFKLEKIKKYSNDQLLFKNKNTREDQYILSSLCNKFDVVIESSGNYKNFISSLSFVKKNGVVIFSGNPNNDIKLSRDQISSVLRKEIIIKGVWNSTFKKKTSNWLSAENFLANGRNDNLEQLITHTIDLEKSPAFLNKIYLAKNKKNKLNYIKGLIKSF
jgi:L-iditol 2-dehydrogenase|tara:strand:+ start:626 stop:1717 length:1092 start_codon:yes stop_codon:yes gene_type:complete